MDFLDKRIVVTGGGGFLGCHLVERLRVMGCPNVFAPRRREFDLRKFDDSERLFRKHWPQVLIHAAAVVGGIVTNEANAGQFFYENAIMGIQLIEVARQYGVEKTVVVGAMCAYPKYTPVPFCERDLWNGYPEETNAPYGIAKKVLLVQCQAYRRQYGMNAIYLLLANLYGPGDNFSLESSHVIPALIRKCVEAVKKGRSEIVLWGDGSATREFLYVEDAADGILAAAQRYDGAEPVNLGSGDEISIRELAEIIGVLTGFSGKFIWDTTKPNGQPRRRLDVSRAERDFGWKASTKLIPGLQKTVDWYRAGTSTREVKVAAR